MFQFRRTLSKQSRQRLDEEGLVSHKEIVQRRLWVPALLTTVPPSVVRAPGQAGCLRFHHALYRYVTRHPAVGQSDGVPTPETCPRCSQFGRSAKEAQAGHLSERGGSWSSTDSEADLSIFTVRSSGDGTPATQSRHIFAASPAAITGAAGP
jgi:hypothetical protein